MRPYLRVANVFEDRIDLRDVMQMHFEPREVTRFELQPGDILLNEGQSRELVGRPAMYRGELPGACFTNSLVRFQAGPSILPAFALALFRHWLHSGAFQRIAQITTNIAHLGAGRFADMELALPPLDEQRRIVAKLDALQARSRRAREALDAVPPLLEKLRQSILAAAFRGDLTKDWRAKNPDVEPATELLKRIRIERHKKWEEAELAKMVAKGKPPTDDRWKAKYKEPEPVDTTGLPELPEGWCWACLEEFTTLVTGGTPPGTEGGCYGGTLPFFKPTDLDAGREVSVARQHLTQRGASFADVLPAHSALITCIGATLGKSGLSTVECATNQQITAAIPIDVAPPYLYWWLTSAFAQNWMGASASATTLPILNKARLARMPVALAPRAEQLALTDTLDIVNARRSALSVAMARGADHFSSLERSMLAMAFRGALVPTTRVTEVA
jgi:type I restriction enzyme S subunit